MLREAPCLLGGPGVGPYHTASRWEYAPVAGQALQTRLLRPGSCTQGRAAGKSPGVVAHLGSVSTHRLRHCSGARSPSNGADASVTEVPSSSKHPIPQIVKNINCCNLLQCCSSQNAQGTGLVELRSPRCEGRCPFSTHACFPGGGSGVTGRARSSGCMSELTTSPRGCSGRAPVAGGRVPGQASRSERQCLLSAVTQRCRLRGNNETEPRESSLKTQSQVSSHQMTKESSLRN